MMTFDKDGETPLDDISGLKIKQIQTRSALDAAEAKNILKAYLKYTVDPSQIKGITFDLPFLQGLHVEMLGDVWSWAGMFRTTQTSIGTKPQNIRQEMYHLLDDLRFWSTHWEHKDTATRLHHTLVKIHPFLNGNGRWARLATDIWLQSLGYDVLAWGSSDITKANSDRREYISALKEADKGSYERLRHFMFH